MKENDLELITAATGLPFNQEVLKARLPEGFKLLVIKAYDRKSDPQDHLDHFNNFMELHLILELAKCRFFAVTLTGVPRSGSGPFLPDWSPAGNN